MTDQPFIHLRVHSAFSLAEGAIKVKDLVKLCKEQKMPAVAVTDTNNMFGAMEFAVEAAKNGIQPIIGTQINIDDASTQIVLLAQNEAGYRNLCRLVSDAYMEGEANAEPTLNLEKLKEFNQGLICLSGGYQGPLGQRLVHGQNDEAKAYCQNLQNIFGDRLYMELQRHGLSQQEEIESRMIDMAYELNIALVATNNCFFPRRGMYEAHDALLCIAGGRYITEDDRRRETKEHYFKSQDEMRELFSDIPEAIYNTSLIAKRCSYLLKPIDPILPPFETESGNTEEKELEDQSRKGLKWRLENFVYTDDMDAGKRDEIPKPYFERLDYELGIIKEMGFPGYFLIVSDFIKWAKDQGIPVGPGRGSGAGSVIAWALKITDLDPLRFNLLFERFLNPERVSMPDFDVDFCQERRDEVIKYVQERYGYDRVAQIITFGKLQARAVVRDVGRVLQIPYPVVDRIAKMIPNNPANPMTLEEALDQDADLRAERYKDDTHDKLITIALQLEGLYRHASTHAAGVVIGDRPLHELLPLYRDPRSTMPVTQFNMKYVEPAGLVKFDFLGLKTLTVIRKAVELIEEKEKRENFDILQVPLDNEITYDLLATGHAIGIFQLESSGMRDVLRKMKPNRFEDIIALVALYRPGPMDNIPKYIATKAGSEEADYMHPLLQPLLEETYGIMVYQEQVMQAAQILAGYSLGNADLLRRAMGKKIKEEMDAQRVTFTAGAKEKNNVPEDQSTTIFDQIEKFAGYGFNKSHAAAYALIAYQTAWLKANYPVEFMAASMTLDKGNTEKLAVFKQELDRMEVPLNGPDICVSRVNFSVEGESIRYALAALKGVGEGAMRLVVDEREDSGIFKNLEDFVGRMDPKSLNRRQLEQLAAAGAFESLVKSRARVYNAADMLLSHANALADERDSGQNSLFGSDSNDGGLGLPDLPVVDEWDPLEKLRYEFDAVGFYLSAHPLDTKAKQFARLRIRNLTQVNEILLDRSSTREKMAGVLLKKQVKVSPKSGNKYAFLQISDASGVYEGMAFSETLMRARDVLTVGESLLLTVDVEKKEDQIRYTIQDVEPLEANLEDKIAEVRLTLLDKDAVASLKDILVKDDGPTGSKIIFGFDIDKGRTVTMRLPGRYNFTADTRHTLFRTAGVTDIQEM
ncbi:MAG: DNA polymerase III subunit alpha [Micavibrio sp.]|nr:DNA polymerase III subunit alpha [Micavibrio sp.]